MELTADRFASDPPDQDRSPVRVGDSSLDVPSRLASRIGDLYASEERLRRQEHADRLIRRATVPSEE